MAISQEQASCTHEFGAPVKGWVKCHKCGFKTRASQLKKEEENTVEEQVQENVVTGTDREGNNITIHGAGEAVESPDLKMPKVEKPEPVEVTLSSGAKTTGPVVTITCVECGKERVIKIQDKFQVTRCIECQKKALNKKRYENRKANKAKKREAAKAEEAQAQAQSE